MSQKITIYLDDKGHYIGPSRRRWNRQLHQTDTVEGALSYTNYQWEESLSYENISSCGGGTAQRVYWWSNQLQYAFTMMMSDFKHFMKNMEIEKKVIVDHDQDMNVCYTVTSTWSFKKIGGQITLKRVK